MNKTKKSKNRENEQKEKFSAQSFRSGFHSTVLQSEQEWVNSAWMSEIHFWSHLPIWKPVDTDTFDGISGANFAVGGDNGEGKEEQQPPLHLDHLHQAPAPTVGLLASGRSAASEKEARRFRPLRVDVFQLSMRYFKCDQGGAMARVQAPQCNGRTDSTNSLSLSLSLYIYIYIYIYKREKTVSFSKKLWWQQSWACLGVSLYSHWLSKHKTANHETEQ